MGSGAKKLLLIAAFHHWVLQAQTEPEVHVAELKIKRQGEHRRPKREQFCQVICLPNWILYNYTCYRSLPVLHTWVDAEVRCQELVPDGHLVSLHSLETSEFLANLAKSELNANLIWVGASEMYKPGTFFWTDGSQWDYFYWQIGNPTLRIQNNYCIQLWCSGPDIFQMRSGDCLLDFAAICEYKPKFD